MKQKKRDAAHGRRRKRAFPHGVPRKAAEQAANAAQRILRGYGDSDVRDFRGWFLRTIPPMLRALRIMGKKHGLETGGGEWESALGRMAFLFREADERTCSRKNRHEAQWEKAWRAFTEKYGTSGEGLLTEEERKSGRCRQHLPNELPENRILWKKHAEEERRLARYRRRCTAKALALFCEWFDTLWL